MCLCKFVWGMPEFQALQDFHHLIRLGETAFCKWLRFSDLLIRV